MPYIGNQHIVGDHINNFKVLDDISSYTETFNGASTNVVSTADNTIRIPEHRFIQGQRVTYTNGGGGNIGGLTTGTAYFVSFDSANTIKLATTLANANSNTVINLSAVGSGTSHTLNAAFDGVNTKFKITYQGGKEGRFNNATQLNVAINNVIQRPNLNPITFTEGFAIEDHHKIKFKVAPTVNDIFWGSIIANTIENFDLRDNEVDNFTGDGSTTEFTLSTIPANNESVVVSIDGVLQHPSDKNVVRAYTLIDSVIQFTAAPALNAEIQVRHIGFAGPSTNDVSGFYGRTGNVALTANDHITTGDITARNFKATGITTFSGTVSTGAVTATSGTFSGNVSIGGTLTYEDVTNIDSVGIITGKGADINGDLDVDGHTNLDNVSVAGVTTFASGNVQLASDSQRLQLGSGQDLWMYHTGTSGGGHGLIQNDYGTMYMLSDNFTFRDRSTNHDVFVISQNNSVSLFYQNSAKLSTTNTGVSVSGTLAATAVTGDGSNLTGIAVTEAPVTDYTITANGNSAYRFAGGGVNSSTDNPDLYLVRGQKYRFNNTTGTGHPFEFRDSANGADYTSGISGSQSGIQFFTVPLDAPALLKYRCTIHTVNMVGNIYIRGAGGHETNVGVTTITGASGNLLNVNHTGGSGAQGVIRTKASQANSSSFIRAEDSGTTYIGLLKYGTGHSAYGALGAGDGALYANSGGGNDANITVMADSATGYINFATGGNSEKVRFTAAGNVGIGTVDPAASNITTALSTNTKSLAVGIVTCNQLFVSGIKVTSGGHYADIAAATADGMSHYFPGSSTTSLISNLSPDSGATLGSPSANNTAGSYFNNYPYFDFYSGNSSENGYRYTQTTAKWANGPFTIAFWAKPMSSTLESESTFVQLGDHPSGVLRCLYTVSTDASRQIKTITIGDDSSALNTAVLTTDWNHWVTTYDGSVTRYYLNGSLARSHTHSGNLDVGTGNKYFWIGFGYWNTSTTNKASMSHMSDIGIWNAKALSAATISSIYNAKRTVVGY